jgi:hypothetical protein
LRPVAVGGNPVPPAQRQPSILATMVEAVGSPPERERVAAELVDAMEAAGGVPAVDGEGAEPGEPSEQVISPTKLIRIATMVRTMLEEVRRAPLDDAGRRRMADIHERSLEALEDVLSPDLQQELSEVVLPLTSDDPSESELRLAQAQLVGWLEGLFHGIQATLFTQQAMAQSQFEEMRRRRALEGGLPQQGPPGGYV